MKRKRSDLNRIVEFFSMINTPCYLVGGTVRDALLNRKGPDIDIMVVGDAIPIAQRLSEKFKGRLKVYKEFKTASVEIGEKRIDLASARKEFYPAPAQLPVVKPGTLFEDLKRRDFSINAIALGISKDNFGEVVDPFNGIRDIRRRHICILHKDSFIDDPTRIFRALRYKNRLGFRLEKNTEALMKEAIEQGMIQRLSGMRILNELKLIFSETSYYKTVKDLIKYKIYQVKPGDIKFLPRAGALKYLFFLALIDWLGSFLSKYEKGIVNDIKELKTKVSQLKKAKKKSEVYYLLSSLRDEVIGIIPSLYPELKEVIQVYKSLKKVKPLIRGDDLQELGMRPGPDIKQILKKAFALQIDCGIKDREELLKRLMDGR